MMRTCPNIKKYQCPEVNDGKTIRINRTIGSFRNKIIHQSQERSGEEKRNGIMSVPPFYQSILNSCINRITLCQTDWQLHRIDNMQHCNGDYCSDIKPDRNI